MELSQGSSGTDIPAALTSGSIASTAGGTVSASTGTLVSGSTAGSTGSVAFTWNDGWRERMANGDEKELKRLQRFSSPDDVYKMARSLETRMSSGEIKSTLRKDATADEAKIWRAENGIPETPDGYEMVFSDGTKVPEEDRDTIKTFLEVAHKLNYTKEQVKAGIDWQYENSQRQTELQQAADEKLTMETVDALRAEWGNDYRANTNMIQTNLDRGGNGLADMVLRGRAADGRPLGSVPEVLKWIVAMERDINPAGTVVPNAGSNQINAIADEIANLEKMMGNRQSDYWKGPKAEANQARYRQLDEARSKLQARG